MSRICLLVAEASLPSSQFQAFRTVVLNDSDGMGWKGSWNGYEWQRGLRNGTEGPEYMMHERWWPMRVP
jgi:hypothetical protein